jgi:hypothetical protein
MHKPWLVLSWFCDLESFSSASLQPITKKQKPENQPSLHTHTHTHTQMCTACTKCIAVRYCVVLLKMCNADERVHHQLLFILKEVTYSMVKKHTWNAINSALIFFSSSVKDFFCSTKRETESLENFFKLIHISLPRSFHHVKHKELPLFFVHMNLSRNWCCFQDNFSERNKYNKTKCKTFLGGFFGAMAAS